MEKDSVEKFRGLDPRAGSIALMLSIAQADELEAKKGLLMPRAEYIKRQTLELGLELEKQQEEVQIRLQNAFFLLQAKIEKLSQVEKEKFLLELARAKEKIALITSQTLALQDKMETLSSCDTLQEVFGFSYDMCTLIYDLGLNFFSRKLFVDSGSLFFLLIYLNNKVADYWSALAFTEKAQGKEFEALYCFATAILLNPSHAQARYNSAEIYLNRGELDDAFLELQELKELVKTDEEKDLKDAYQALYKKVQAKKSSVAGAL